MRYAFLLLAAAALLLTACNLGGTATSPAAPPGGAGPTHLPRADWGDYHDGTAGFALQRPLSWRQSVTGGYPVVFSLNAAPGTVLINKALLINVKPNSGACKETIYNQYGGTPARQNVSVNGVAFLKETATGNNAGQIYNWTAYSTVRGPNCISVTFLLHSAAPDMFDSPPGSFDKTAESKVFDQILSTFQFGP
jgi:hypothetical protein